MVDNVASYTHETSTEVALSSEYDLCPSYERDESGPENLFVFTVTERMMVRARIGFAAPDGMDNAIHLFGDFDPAIVIAYPFRFLSTRTLPTVDNSGFQKKAR